MGLEETTALEKQDLFLDAIHGGGEVKAGYVQTIQSLDENALSLGTAWLQGVVDRITREAFETVPLCQ